MRQRLLSATLSVTIFLASFLAPISGYSQNQVTTSAEIDCEALFSANTEHRTTCEDFRNRGATIRQVLASEVSEPGELNNIVEKSSDGELLIIPARPASSPYLLTRPLKMRPNMGLLSTGSGANGFMFMAPADHFSIGNDLVYSLLTLANGNTITGIGIDARTFSSSAISMLDDLTIDKVLVYGKGLTDSTITWTSLHARLNMLAAFRNESDKDRTANTSGVHKLRRSWLEANGAEVAAVVETRDTNISDTTQLPDELDLKHLMIRVSGNTPYGGQTGLYVKNGRGAIEHNYFQLETSSTSKTRVLMVLEDLYDPAQASMPGITENHFYSPHRTKRDTDEGIQFIQGTGKFLEVNIFANSFTNNLQFGSFANNPSVGPGVRLAENYKQSPLDYTPSWQEFFGATNSVDTFPRAGTCLTPLYATLNASRVIDSAGENVWSEFCGSRISNKEFNLQYEYTGQPCLSSTTLPPLTCPPAPPCPTVPSYTTAPASPDSTSSAAECNYFPLIFTSGVFFMVATASLTANIYLSRRKRFDYSAIE